MMENSWECVEFREMSPGGREVVTSGGEREKHRAWTHDIKVYQTETVPISFSYLHDQSKVFGQ